MAETSKPYARCDRAPRGWYCTRDQGHDGPCAARPRWWAHPVLFLRYRFRG